MATPEIKFKINELVKSNIFKLVLFAIATRIALLFIGYLSIAVNSNPTADVVSFDLKYFRNVFQSLGQGDIGWYLNIAENGYEERVFSLEKQANWAFFPLWPTILKATSILNEDIFVNGLYLSNLLFLASIVYLYKLIKINFDNEVAVTCVTLMIVFPFSYYFLRPGPESLFMLTTISSIFYAKKEKWMLAGVLGSLATLTRLQGIILFLPLVYIYLKQYKISKRHNPKAFSIFLLPLALVLFMYYLYGLTGNFFASFQIQKTWGNTPSYPLASIIEYFAKPTIISYWGWDVSVLTVSFILSSILLTLIILRYLKEGYLPLEYIIYTIFSLYIVVSRNALLSSPRYLLTIFPLYLMLSIILPKRKLLYGTIIYTFICMQMFYFIFLIIGFKWAAT